MTKTWNLNKDEGIFAILDCLTFEEIDSLLKSNRIDWNTRKFIRFYIANRNLRECIPIIASAIIGNTICQMIHKEIIEATIDEN